MGGLSPEKRETATKQEEEEKPVEVTESPSSSAFDGLKRTFSAWQKHSQTKREQELEKSIETLSRHSEFEQNLLKRIEKDREIRACQLADAKLELAALQNPDDEEVQRRYRKQYWNHVLSTLGIAVACFGAIIFIFLMAAAGCSNDPKTRKQLQTENQDMAKLVDNLRCQITMLEGDVARADEQADLLMAAYNDIVDLYNPLLKEHAALKSSTSEPSHADASMLEDWPALDEYLRSKEFQDMAKHKRPASLVAFVVNDAHNQFNDTRDVLRFVESHVEVLAAIQFPGDDNEKNAMGAAILSVVSLFGTVILSSFGFTVFAIKALSIHAFAAIAVYAMAVIAVLIVFQMLNLTCPPRGERSQNTTTPTAAQSSPTIVTDPIMDALGASSSYSAPKRPTPKNRAAKKQAFVKKLEAIFDEEDDE